MEELLAQARRNEDIQRRLERVEQLLLAHHDLSWLLSHLAPAIAQTYQLPAVSLVLLEDNPRFRQALPGYPDLKLPAQVTARPRKELRLWLVDLERPFLTNRIHPELADCLFPQPVALSSLAAAPLWVRGELLGALCLGSDSPQRFHPSLETHYLESLARKSAQALDAALLLEQNLLMQRRQAAMEMAGAACHEMSQPLTTLTLELDILLRQTPADDPRLARLLSLQNQVEQLGEMVQRISQVREYVTRPYAQGLRIIDLDAASAPGRALESQEVNT